MLLDDLFASESDAEMEARFAALREEMNWRRDEAARQEREARKRSGRKGRVGAGRPRRRVSDEALAAAAADFGGTLPDRSPEGSEGGQ